MQNKVIMRYHHLNRPGLSVGRTDEERERHVEWGKQDAKKVVYNTISVLQSNDQLKSIVKIHKCIWFRIIAWTWWKPRKNMNSVASWVIWKGGGGEWTSDVGVEREERMSKWVPDKWETKAKYILGKMHKITFTLVCKTIYI